MIHFLLLILKVISVAIGLFLIITRVFLYEETQGKIESAIEDLWIRVEDFHQSALSRHTSFMKVVAGMMVTGFNWVFGENLISLQAFTVSICYAIATALALILLLLSLGLHGWDFGISSLLLFCLIAGTLPAWIRHIYKDDQVKREKVMLVWLTVLITMAFDNIIFPLFNFTESLYSTKPYMLRFILLLYLAVLIALAFYLLCLTFVRVSLRSISVSQSFFKIAIILLLNTLPVFALYGLFKAIMFEIDNSGLVEHIDSTNEAAIINMRISS